MTVYGWDGDVLAWESRANAEDVDELFRYVPGAARTTHYVYEPGSFVPLAPAVRQGQINVHAQPAYAGDYDFDADPLWHTEITPVPFDTVAYYHCDHLGTPQEITGPDGEIAWSAQYKAWGAAQETFGNTARKAGIHNPLRFQGQYFDHETGLHYNRHRYYDPEVGRYVSKDPMGLEGGLNAHLYVEGSPVSNSDPLGLETYLCSRPLDGFHGVSVGPFFHQFLCTLDAQGNANCGGLGPRDGSSGMFGGPGVIEWETSVRPEQCGKVRDQDQCFEKCVNDSLARPAPNYDVRAGRPWLFPSTNTQQCQVYARSVLDKCSAECRK